MRLSVFDVGSAPFWACVRSDDNEKPEDDEDDEGDDDDLLSSEGALRKARAMRMRGSWQA